MIPPLPCAGDDSFPQLGLDVLARAAHCQSLAADLRWDTDDLEQLRRVLPSRIAARLLHAWGLSRSLGLRQQVLVQMLVLAISAAGHAADGWHTVGDIEGSPLLAVIVTVAAGVGLPFFALSTSASVLQNWFAAGARHAERRDPYFLCAASNLGSFVALIALPRCRGTLVQSSRTAPRMGAWLFHFLSRRDGIGSARIESNGLYGNGVTLSRKARASHPSAGGID